MLFFSIYMGPVHLLLTVMLVYYLLRQWYFYFVYILLLPVHYCDLHETSNLEKIGKSQQKGLEDYKLATANASMNADFSMEERANDVHSAMAAMSLDCGDADHAASPTDKQAAAAKEVWTTFCPITMRNFCWIYVVVTDYIFLVRSYMIWYEIIKIEVCDNHYFSNVKPLRMLPWIWNFLIGKRTIITSPPQLIYSVTCRLFLFVLHKCFLCTWEANSSSNYILCSLQHPLV